MEKEFNVTGNCIPALHYMADVSAKFRATMQLVEKGKYFTINRPRQYGKTTMLFQLAEALAKSGQYVVFRISFEGIGGAPFEGEETFCPAFLELLRKRAKLAGNQTLVDFFDRHKSSIPNLEALSEFVSDLAHFCVEKMVLLIDEVDKSSNNQLFLHFLGMLRDKYLARTEQPTFHSIILAGIHDVKSLKLKIQPESEKKFNSPWNIAADFDVDMNLQPHEIKPMLEEYAHDRVVQLDSDALAERLFYYTSGYPFLVSKLCKIFDEKLLPLKMERTWTLEDVDTAADALIRESNTNFDSMTKELEHNSELFRFIEDILLHDRHFPFAITDPIINIGVTHGIFADRKGVAIHNRIYQEVIYNHIILRAMRNQTRLDHEFFGNYVLPGNHLDMDRVLLRFQNLMREEYSQKDADFLERQGRLLFLCFLKPILNGQGHAFKEPQISEEKRLDILISYHQHKYIAELKIWRGPKAHKAGLQQLADYLERQHLEQGYLVIFDPSQNKTWKTQRLRTQGKRIFAVWV